MTPFQRELETAFANQPETFTVNKGLWGGWEIRRFDQRVSRIFESQAEAISWLEDKTNP